MADLGLGKAEVGSSILPNSTISPLGFLAFPPSTNGSDRGGTTHQLPVKFGR